MAAILGPMEARGPIFVTADEPLLVFESLRRVLGYIEWPDVEDDLYRGYDAEGRLIEFATTESTRRWGLLPREKSVVCTVEPEPTHAGDLRDVLVHVLSVDPSEGRDLAKASLEELQRRAVDRFGMTG
jgi:hypothetical protein